MGVTKPISTGYLLNIAFLFDRCRCSSADVTPVKYENGSYNQIMYFCKIENFSCGEMNDRGFSNFHTLN